MILIFFFFFQFFMKATQLEQMRETFVYIKATKQATQHKIEQQNEVRKPSKGFQYKVSHGTSPTVYHIWDACFCCSIWKGWEKITKGRKSVTRAWLLWMKFKPNWKNYRKKWPGRWWDNLDYSDLRWGFMRAFCQRRVLRRIGIVLRCRFLSWSTIWNQRKRSWRQTDVPRKSTMRRSMNGRYNTSVITFA